MADLIRVDYEEMESLATDMKRLGNSLEALKSRIRGIRVDQESGANVQIPISAVRLLSINQAMRSGNTTECLRNLAGNLASLNDYADALAGNIARAFGNFEDAERRLVSNFNGLMTPEELMLGIAQSLGYGTSPEGWTPSMKEKIQKIIGDARVITDEDMTFVISGQQGFLFDPRGLIGSITTKIGLSGITATSRIFDGSHRHESEAKIGLMDGGFSYKDSVLKPKDIIRKSGQFDENGNYTEGKKESGKGIGLFSVGASVGESYSRLGENRAWENGALKMEGGVGVGNAEAKAGIKGGLGAYLPGEDGSAQLTVGVAVEAGVSVSAVNAEGSLEYELCDNISVGLEGEVTALEAEAGVEGGLGYVDGKIMAYGEASAELNVVEAGIDGKLDLGLVEGKVGGSVTVGLGAHAKGGYDDGVLSFDVGASFGVGASVRAEIDIGGTIDKIGEYATKGWNMLQSAFSG